MSIAESALPESLQSKLEDIESTTKKGFNLKDRLQNRGLRQASIILYLDEDVAAELGDAVPQYNQMQVKIGTLRDGIIGELDEIAEARAAATKEHDRVSSIAKAADKAKLKESYEAIVAKFDERTAELEKEKAAIVAKLEATGLTVKVRAVPPVIQKDAHRRARATLGLTEKGIPEDREAEYNASQFLHLLTMLVQSVRDHETDETMEGLSYEDASALVDYLPKSQFDRLDMLIGEVQFSDAISRSIESQEDFS